MNFESKSRSLSSFMRNDENSDPMTTNQSDNEMIGGVMTFEASEFYSSKRAKEEALLVEKQRSVKRVYADENIISIPASDFYKSDSEKDGVKGKVRKPLLSNRVNSNMNVAGGSDSDSCTIDSFPTRKIAKPVHHADKENAASSAKLPSESAEWLKMQSMLYSDWMNFMFSKMYSIISVDAAADTAVSGSTSPEINHHIIEALVLKEYGFISQNAKFMLKAQCDIGIFRMLDRECNSGHIQMRDDRDITVDVGLQADLMELLYSYELPWLKLGLEIVSNRPITIKKNGETYYTIKYGENSNMWKKSIKVHVLKNILYDEGIVSQFQSMAQTMKTEKLMKDALRKHALKHLLSLIFLLDKFREAELLKLPTLFEKNSGIRSSKDMMLAFCKTFMKGEGDFSKHLNELGFITNFKQNFADEFDYRITDMSVDLRDGVRLAKLLELLNGNQYSNISSSLRVPAVSRLQKIFNVEKVVSAVIPSEASKVSKLANLIVEGDMTATFLFLWEVFFRHEANTLIDDAAIYREIKAIRSNMEWRRSIYGEHEARSFAIKVPTRLAESGRVDYPPIVANARMLMDDEEAGGNAGEASTPFSDQAHISNSLQDWCHSIVSQYGLSVDNLESSLSDGRVLCVLIHYYHPKILLLSDIQKPVSRTTPRGLGEGVSVYTSAEKKNFLLLKKACKSIGGIPWMLEDVEKTSKIEEKTMILFLSYLFNRLIESSNSVRAVIKLQRWFRSLNPVAPSKDDQSMDISGNKNTEQQSLSSIIQSNREVKLAVDPEIRIFVTSKKPEYYSALKIQRCFRKHTFRSRLASAIERNRQQRLEEALFNYTGVDDADIKQSEKEEEKETICPFDMQSDIVTPKEESYNARRSSGSIGGKRRSSCSDELKSIEPEPIESHQFVDNYMKMDTNVATTRAVIDEEVLAAKKREIEDEVRREYECRRKQELENQRKLSEMTSAELAMFQSELQRTKMEAEEAARHAEILEHDLTASTSVLQMKLEEEYERLKQEREARLAAEAKYKQLLESIDREKQLKAEATKKEETRKQMLRQKKAAASLVIQKTWRRFHFKNVYNIIKTGVLTFQCNYRGYRVREAIRKQQRDEQKRAWERSERQRLANIEAMERNRLASIEEANRLKRFHEISCSNKIKSMWRSHLITLRTHKLVSGFKRLQAVFQARKVIKQSSPAVMQSRLKLKKLDILARSDSKLQLGHRTKYALQVLKEGKMITQYLKACQILEFSTRYSTRCCEAFAEAQASQILFGIIRSCNRSTPHEELLRNVMIVLLNVARRSHLAKVMGEFEECSEILVDRMQMSRDKKDLFCLTTELLCRLVHGNASQKVVCNGFRSRVETILSILERKHRLDCKLKGIAPLATQFTSPMKGERGKAVQIPSDNLSMLARMEPIECLQFLIKLLNE